MSTINGYLMESSTINTTDTGIHNQSYTGFTFNGNCILDSIYIQNYVKTDTQILNTSVNTLPDWTPDILFLASMNNTVDASNVFGLTQSQTKWILARQEVGKDTIVNIVELIPNITTFVDYKVAGMKLFQYLIYAANDNQLSAPLITDSIKTTFYGFYLLDAEAIDNNEDYVETYKFDLNTTSDNIVGNNDFVSIKNFTSKDNVVIGKRDFLSGSITGILAYPDDTNEEVGYSWDADYIDKFRTFIGNGKMKYFKMRNGKVLKVVTGNTSESFNVKFQDEVVSQIPTVSLHFQEVADVDK